MSWSPWGTWDEMSRIRNVSTESQICSCFISFTQLNSFSLLSYLHMTMSVFLLVFLLLQEATRPWNHYIGQMGWHWHIGWVWKQVMQFNVWTHEQCLDALLCYSQKLFVKYIGHVDKLVTTIFWMEWPFYWNQNLLSGTGFIWAYSSRPLVSFLCV
jgi:hypothetical protein